MIVKNHIRFILATIVLSTCIVFVYRDIFVSPDEAHNPNKEFPSRILDWTADEVPYDKTVLSVLSPDKIIYKSYHRDGSPPITLFIAYYNTLEKADLSHSPVVCFTGQGWEIENMRKIEIPVNRTDIPKIKVNEIIQKKLNTIMIALFWYQSANNAFSNRGIQKISLLFNKLSGKLDSNAFVRVTATVAEGMSVEETTSHLFSFVQDVYPEIRGFII